MEQDTYIQNVNLAKQGDQQAFVQLIKELEPTLYRVSKAIMKSEEECLDATQEAILKAYSSLHGLKEAKYFKTWLVRILINECYRIVREKKAVVPIGDYIEQSANRTTPDFYNQKLELHEAIAELENDLKVVITLYYLEDLSLKSISQVLKIPEGTIKSRLARARQKLAEMLNPILEERGVRYE